ncbi:hypothetical protein ARA02_09570 (plasmid) [Leuconostoc mesenteroides subsp. jonggajibkimchii]|uniref:helix-turn-helix domain-containing protein n=1 Tax=Leuconostoc mesenteroides TaxID=1245 RepID=UPI000903E458|nr:helix-turn-helix transcriptional regulator [Leuconostoc mesenteroides]APE77576.1 hypothetical protein ARA02_09570 [Leuconostoc mesenteroides subsp. jonggajibkimchii]MCT3053418.1 XRE family transcriptional regulator [Leuconostoc mesenteroides]
MDYKSILAKLSELKQIMENNADGTVAYHKAGQEYDAILFENMTFREYTFIVQHMTHEVTTEDDVKLIIAAANNKRLSDVVELTPSAQLAYTVKWHRQEQKLTQVEIAKITGMSQSQIAKVETANMDIGFSGAAKVLKAVGAKISLA